MPHPEPRIQCSNPHCVASNTLEARFCHRCNTPTVKRYLWSNKIAIDQEQIQTLIDGRYLAMSPQIFLDTQPSKPPITPEEVPSEIVAYLQLFSCYPHVPQIYGLLNREGTWLLDYGTVPITSSGELAYSQELVPALKDLWSNATGFQQLNWLWQIAKLWKPLSSKNVVSTLLDPDLIRINGQAVQLLQLKFDLENRPNLKNLGSLWMQWGNSASPDVRDVIQQLGSNLEAGKINKIVQAIAVLDRAIDRCRKSREYYYQVYALSDSGPNRSNNEDAAYPIHSDPRNIPQSTNSLAIVCDGVGGHDGGEIASNETIKYLRNKISKLALEEQNHSPGKVLGKLTKYINGSNDSIDRRNDSEQRHERQRMGTTLVMSLSCAHEMYLAHVGDSRIYWITANSCHQVTTDDDLASREVRLGYAIYRDALQYPSAGALIQAIGMRDSAALHPNLQRYMIEDDCIFLLCTDGLSDFDRVEQYWQHQILPVLTGKQDLATAVENLVDIANRDNGHDNVTVALVHCKVISASDSAPVKVSWSDVEFAIGESNLWSDANLTSSFTESSTLENTPPETAKIPEEAIGEGETLPIKRQPKWLKPLVLILIVSTIISLIGFIYLKYSIPKEERPPKIEGTDLGVQ